MNFDACTTTSDASGTPYHVRLKRLREQSGKPMEEIEFELGIDFIGDTRLFDYEEIENYPHELTYVVSLAIIAKLAHIFRIHPRQIFEDRVQDGQTVSPQELITKIKAHLQAKGLTLNEFEDVIGFGLGGSLSDASEVMDWHVDCLRFVCAEIGVDWLAALPTIAS